MPQPILFSHWDFVNFTGSATLMENQADIGSGINKACNLGTDQEQVLQVRQQILGSNKVVMDESGRESGRDLVMNFHICRIHPTQCQLKLPKVSRKVF